MRREEHKEHKRNCGIAALPLYFAYKFNEIQLQLHQSVSSLFEKEFTFRPRPLSI